MKKIILPFILLILKSYVYAEKIYSYDDILENYKCFDKSNNFDGIIDGDKYLKDPDDEWNYYAEFKDKNLKVTGYRNTIIINNKKFNIRNLPGIGKYKKDNTNWRQAFIYKNSKSICIETTSMGSRYPHIIFIENFEKPKPYYFNGLFLYCTYMRMIKNKFYIPTYELFGSQFNNDAEKVKVNYRQISPGFPIKYKFEGKFINASDDSEFELTKSEIVK